MIAGAFVAAFIASIARAWFSTYAFQDYLTPFRVLQKVLAYGYRLATYILPYILPEGNVRYSVHRTLLH